MREGPVECTIGKHGQATADQARKEAKGKMGDLAKGQDIQTEKKIAHFWSKARKHQTLGGFIEAKYKPWVLIGRKTEQEIITNLSRDFEYLFPRPMADIAPRDVRKWRTDKIKQGLRPCYGESSTSHLKGLH